MASISAVVRLCTSGSLALRRSQKIRQGLAAAGLPNSTIQQISDLSDPTSKNDVVIGLEQQGQGDQALDAGKQTIIDVLHKTFGGDTSGKPDFNSVSACGLGRLPDPEGSRFRSA